MLNLDDGRFQSVSVDNVTDPRAGRWRELGLSSRQTQRLFQRCLDHSWSPSSLIFNEYRELFRPEGDNFDKT